MNKKPVTPQEILNNAYFPSPLNAIAELQKSLPDAEFGIHGDGIHVSVNGKTVKLPIRPDLAEIATAVEALKAA